MPRIELPWAATSTVLPRWSAGMMSDFQYGRQRSTVSLRHSDSGISSSGMCAYLLSFPGQYSLDLSIGGGGVEYERRHCLTCASYLATVSFLFSPVSPPYIRSFSRQLLFTGTSSAVIEHDVERLPAASATRVRHVDLDALLPHGRRALRRLVLAERRQLHVRPAVKRLPSFHTLWPCRKR